MRDAEEPGWHTVATMPGRKPSDHSPQDRVIETNLSTTNITKSSKSVMSTWQILFSIQRFYTVLVISMVIEDNI